MTSHGGITRKKWRPVGFVSGIRYGGVTRGNEGEILSISEGNGGERHAFTWCIYGASFFSCFRCITIYWTYFSRISHNFHIFNIIFTYCIYYFYVLHIFFSCRTYFLRGKHVFHMSHIFFTYLTYNFTYWTYSHIFEIFDLNFYTLNIN